MRTGIILTILFAQAALPCVGFGGSTGSSQGRAYFLPWQMIAEKVREGSWFCENKNLPDSNTLPGITDETAGLSPDCNYAYQPKQAITVKLTERIADYGSLSETGFNVTKCVEGSWQDIGKVRTSTEPNRVIVSDGIAKQGFFRLSFALKTQDGRLSNFEAYAIVSNNWKKDILSFCRKLKEDIELDPDAQLIRSSIATSHFDHTMEVVSQASFLSGKILTTLADAVWSKKALDNGQCPDLVTGLNKIRFKRFEEAPVEEFVVFIPDSYKSSKAWPVFLHTDNRRWGARDNYSSRSGLIDMWWHTVSHKDLRWKDYRAFMKIIEQKLNIDKNRIYVNGECGNGIAAMALALNYPDQWAECSMSLGNSYRHLAGNAFNLPLIFVKGGHNQDPLVGYYDFAVECFKYHGCKYFKHSKLLSIAQARGRSVPVEQRNISPYRVSYTVESLANPKAYWVQIDGREDENFIASIDAIVWGQSILLKTKNIDAYNLDLALAPVDANRPIEIIENGQSLGFAVNKVFSRKSEKYKDAVYIKNKHLHGPVWDAFTDPYVVIWGTGGEDKELSKASEKVARSLAGRGPCFADINVPDELVDSNNLILVGTVESNLWLSKICKNLPVQIKGDKLTADGKHYDGRDMGFILIYPNPLNPKRYAVVFSGTSSRAMMNISKAYSQMKSIRPADVGVFEITKTGSIKWHIIEKFNTVWGWHDEWDRVLAETNKKHPHWQWRQWVTRALRKQLEVDVVVCEDPLMFEDSMPVGQITYRDLFNNLRNYWILTIRISGKSLRALLAVPFTDISKREVNAPIIEGVSLIKNPADDGEKILEINELIDDKIYTVALPEKCINGQRIGLVFQDYNIVNQMYLVPILKEHLKTDPKANIDRQLDSLKLAIF